MSLKGVDYVGPHLKCQIYAQVSNSHLTGCDSDFIACADLTIHYKGSSFAVHTQLISWKCPNPLSFPLRSPTALPTTLRTSNKQELSRAPPSPPPLQDPHPQPPSSTFPPQPFHMNSHPTLLLLISNSSSPRSIKEISPPSSSLFLLLSDHSLSDIEAVLHLSRYFGATDILAFIDQYLLLLPPPPPHHVNHHSSTHHLPIHWDWACGAFQLATKFHLTCCTCEAAGMGFVDTVKRR